ncbi:MAG: hypothetical protein WC755_03340 [Candidatus Woesearchaeota archaeon]
MEKIDKVNTSVNTKIKIEQKTIEKSNLVKKFSTGAISACVWLNESLNQSGEIIEYKTVSFDKRYLDKNTKEWKSTNTLRISDLPKAVLVLSKAYEYLTLREDLNATIVHDSE